MRLVRCDKCGKEKQLEKVFLGTAVPDSFWTISRYDDSHLCDDCYIHFERDMTKYKKHRIIIKRQNDTDL